MIDAKLNLADAAKIPLAAAETVVEWGNVLIVAPHPDDESLGCGGAIALLRRFNLEVSILILSDGTLSHPNSQKYPKEKLRDLRETELKSAAQILGVGEKSVKFFRFPDRAVPNANSPDFDSAVALCLDYLTQINARTIFVPWRRDPHPDHRAAFQLISRAKKTHHKIIEYPIWLYELAESVDAPLKREVSAFRLDINSVVETKRRAIGAHVSQITDLIDDDPDGFRLSGQMLANFAAPFEVYFEEIQ